jgi:hypothetical protein
VDVSQILAKGLLEHPQSLHGLGQRSRLASRLDRQVKHLPGQREHQDQDAHGNHQFRQRKRLIPRRRSADAM